MSKLTAIQNWLDRHPPQSVKDTALIDQHHIGGLSAARQLFTDLTEAMPQGAAALHALDIGCGYGGPARFMAQQHGVNIRGIDMDAAAIEIAAFIHQKLGLSTQVHYQMADAVTFHAPRTFDIAFMIHSSMAIKDKAALYHMIATNLKQNGLLGIYDVYKTGATDSVTYPVPWARSISQSFLETVEEALTRLQESGFTILDNKNYTADALQKTEEALTFVMQNEAAAEATQIVLGTNYWQKLENLHNALKYKLCAPHMIIARKT